MRAITVHRVRVLSRVTLALHYSYWLLRHDLHSIAMQVVHQMIVRESGGLFDIRTGSDAPPLLLIVDRRDDAVTPLLLQVGHEFLLH